MGSGVKGSQEGFDDHVDSILCLFVLAVVAQEAEGGADPVGLGDRRGSGHAETAQQRLARAGGCASGGGGSSRRWACPRWGCPRVVWRHGPGHS